MEKYNSAYLDDCGYFDAMVKITINKFNTLRHTYRPRGAFYFSVREFVKGDGAFYVMDGQNDPAAVAFTIRESLVDKAIAAAMYHVKSEYMRDRTQRIAELIDRQMHPEKYECHPEDFPDPPNNPNIFFDEGDDE